MNDERAVEQAALQREGRADDQDRHQRAAGLDDARDLRGRALQQRLLEEQVVIGVGGDAKLGKQRNRALLVVRHLRQTQRLGAVGLWIGNANFWNADRHPGKAVTVDIVEHHAFRLKRSMPRPPVTRKTLICNSFRRDLRGFFANGRGI